MSFSGQEFKNPAGIYEIPDRKMKSQVGNVISRAGFKNPTGIYEIPDRKMKSQAGKCDFPGRI